MGGNGPFVVMEDADLDAAAEAAQVGCFLGAGQSCSAAERLLVHEAVREDFVARLAEQVKRDVHLGDPLEEATTLGPLNNEPGAAKMDEHVADAVERGAEVVAGGARADGFPTRLYWPATVLDRVPADSIAATQETFGPIAPVVSVGSLEEAIEQTNSQSFGLMAAIFTADLAAGMRFADSVHMGLVNINETTNYWETHLPWGGGGRSDSGIGRVGGRYPMDTLTELQTVLVGTERGRPHDGRGPAVRLHHRRRRIGRLRPRQPALGDPSNRVLVLEAGRPDWSWDAFIHMPAALAFPIGTASMTGGMRPSPSST